MNETKEVKYTDKLFADLKDAWLNFENWRQFVNKQQGSNDWLHYRLCTICDDLKRAAEFLENTKDA